MQIDTLSRVPLFSNLNDEQLQCIAGLGSEIAIDRGTQVAKQGDPPDGFYIILSGQIEWTRNVGGEIVPAVTLNAGEVFAELILLLEQRSKVGWAVLTI
jgi:CRP-like cAMP-binding protein